MARKRNTAEVIETETTETPEAPETPVKVSKRTQKISVEFPDNDTVRMICLGGNAGVKDYKVSELPESLHPQMLQFALYKKLGSQGAAAGKEGTDAEESIDKVYNGLKNGDWTVRAPASPKVSVKTVVNNLAELPEEEQAAARALLEKMGLSLPG